MTKEEFEGFIDEQKKGGKSEEDIVKIFSLMFQDEKLERDQYEAVLNALGYSLGDSLKGLSDDELRKAVIKADDKETEEGADKDEASVDPDGKPAPMAKGESEPEEEEEEEEEEGEDKPTESEDESEPEDGEDEKKKAMGLFGLK